MVIQINGKVKARLEVPPDISMADAETEALEVAPSTRRSPVRRPSESCHDRPGWSTSSSDGKASE